MSQEGQQVRRPVTGLTRGAMPLERRSVSWYDPASGEVLDERDVVAQRIRPGAEVSEVLRTVRSRVLYLLPDAGGKVPGRSWYAGATKIGCTVDKYLAKTHSATISRGPKVIDIYPMSQYFDTAPDVMTCKRAWTQLGSMLRGVFPSEHAILLGTASATGLHLLRLALPKGQIYEPLAEPIRDLLLHNFGQGRVETFPPQVEVLNDLYEIDGVFTYAACLRDLPTGQVLHDSLPDFAGYTPGFYRVLALVPDGWSHIGLLPAYDEQAARRRSDTKSWYPRDPGVNFESWATHFEVRLALEQGWPLQIQERLLWPERSTDPLRAWGEKLKRLREQCEHLEEPLRSMLREALRNIVLKGVGGLHRHETGRDRYVPMEQLEEVGSDLWEIEDSETIHVIEEGELSRTQLQTLQPHWTGAIWGQARFRLAKAALQLPFEDLVALRTDGIWTRRDIRGSTEPMWQPTGKPGSWRVKYAVHEPLYWPRDNTEMVATLQYVKSLGKVA